MLRALDLVTVDLDLSSMTRDAVRVSTEYLAKMTDSNDAFATLRDDMLAPCFPGAAGRAVYAAVQCAAAASQQGYKLSSQDTERAYSLDMLRARCELLANGLIATLSRKQGAELWNTVCRRPALELARVAAV